MEIIKPTDSTVEHKGILKVKETLKNGGWAFFDIDGTLEYADGIPDDLPNNLQRLRNIGIETGICTGRCPTEVLKFFNKIGFSDRQLFSEWLLLEDSHVVIEPNKSMEHARVMTEQETLQEMKSFEELFTSEWLPSEAIPGWGFLRNLPAPPVRLSPYPHAGSVSIWERGPYESPEYALMMAWAVSTGQSLGIQRVEFLENGDGTLRLLQKGINKGTGLKTLAEEGVIDLSRTVYFGDANNDLAPARVIREAGGAVVSVANATRAFKGIASHVAFQPGGAGVIEVIKQL